METITHQNAISIVISICVRQIRALIDSSKINESISEDEFFMESYRILSECK